MRHIQPMSLRRVLDTRLQRGPTCKTVFPRKRELRIRQLESGLEDLGVLGFSEARMKLADTLRGVWPA
jgi:hypothetical protein